MLIEYTELPAPEIVVRHNQTVEIDGRYRERPELSIQFTYNEHGELVWDSDKAIDVYVRSLRDVGIIADTNMARQEAREIAQRDVEERLVEHEKWQAGIMREYIPRDEKEKRKREEQLGKYSEKELKLYMQEQGMLPDEHDDKTQKTQNED